MMTEPFGQRQLDGAAMRAATGAAQAFSDGRDGVVRAEGADKAIDIEFNSVGAFIADRQEGVAGSDVGEGGGH